MEKQLEEKRYKLEVVKVSKIADHKICEYQKGVIKRLENKNETLKGHNQEFQSLLQRANARIASLPQELSYQRTQSTARDDYIARHYPWLS